MASGAVDRRVKIWDAASKLQAHDLGEVHKQPVYAVSWSPDGRFVATGSGDTYRVVARRQGAAEEGRGGVRQGRVPVPRGAQQGAGTAWPGGPPAGRSRSGCRTTPWCCRRSMPDGRVTKGPTLQAHEDAVSEVAWTRDGRRLASVGYDRRIAVWDPETGRPVTQRVVEHTEPIQALAVHPGGRLLATGSWDGTIRLWHIDDLRPLHVETEPLPSAVEDLGLDADGERLASASVRRNRVRVARGAGPTARAGTETMGDQPCRAFLGWLEFTGGAETSGPLRTRPLDLRRRGHVGQAAPALRLDPQQRDPDAELRPGLRHGAGRDLHLPQRRRPAVAAGRGLFVLHPAAAAHAGHAPQVPARRRPGPRQDRDRLAARDCAAATRAAVRRAVQHGHPQLTVSDLLGTPLPADLLRGRGAWTRSTVTLAALAVACSVKIVDEYNRIPTKTQSALLTADGRRLRRASSARSSSARRLGVVPHRQRRRGRRRPTR
ncbi:MAG: hypothetical protein MZV63_06150 [Marinilabiliales bacterium]|nr:hypothetical protein [Marinilabiliales bacterium]